MNPVQWSVRRPYTVAVAVVMALLFSGLAARRIPVQLKPTVDAPIITVSTAYRGASPAEIEGQITREIEDLLQGVDSLYRMTSTSLEGLSTVSLEYTWGVDKDRAVVDVINKLSQLPDLPADAEEPIVSLTDVIGETAMWMRTVSHYEPDRVRQIVADHVEPLLERVPGVSGLVIIGGEEREVRLLVDPEKLAAHALSFDQLADALRRGHVDLRGGTVETPTRRVVVRTEGRGGDPDDMLAIIVRRDASGTVRVGDVATVVDGHRERTSVCKANLDDSVAMGVRREPGANVIDLVEGLDAQITMLNARFADQGIDLTLLPVYRDTTYLHKALAFVRGNLLMGAGLAVLVMLLFLRSLRSLIVVAAAIPISLVTVFLVMDVMGRTLNVISLAGLAFAAGMVVDNAIVVLENIFRHMESGESLRDSVEEGGREVWGGVLAATLTTIAVFLPILGIEEEAGQLFADLAIAISAAVGMSLVVALTVVPTLTAIVFRGKPTGAATRTRRDGPFTRAYTRAVAALTARGATAVVAKLAVLALVIAVSILATRLVPPAGYLPTGNRNMIFFFAQRIPGMRAEALAQAMLPLEQWMMDQPETDRYFMVISPGFNGGGAMLKEELADGPTLDAYLQRMMPVAMGIPGYRAVVPIRTSLFRDSGKQFTLQISGPDLAVLGQAERTLKEQLASVEGVQPFGILSDFVEGQPEMKVTIDPHLAGEAGMSVAEVGRVVEVALAGRYVGVFSDGGRDYDVNLVVPQERIADDLSLAALPLVTPSGQRTNLGALATVERRVGPESIQRIERERAITLSVNLTPAATLEGVLDHVQSELVDPLLLTLPSEYRVELGGSADKFSSTLESLTGSFWLAVLITYLLLVALFRSWMQPVVILVSVPLALTGGLLGIAIAHALSPDATFDLLSMMGFVILAGIVVNNAILIVHQANNLAETMDRREALSSAARSRLRPILMSVTTTVFGMLPLAIGQGAGAELYQGLAAVVVGGLLVSTVFTLFVVPALVSLGWDVAEVFGGTTRNDTPTADQAPAAPTA